MIDGAIGEFSPFHETHGYYAQGVDGRTSVLPLNWRHRLVRLQNENTNGKLGLCLDPVDLFLAKCVAWREKDRAFNKALLQEGFIKLADVLVRLPEMPVAPEELARIEARIRRLAA
jgi:hypothetical protein